MWDVLAHSRVRPRVKGILWLWQGFGGDYIGFSEANTEMKQKVQKHRTERQLKKKNNKKKKIGLVSCLISQNRDERYRVQPEETFDLFLLNNVKIKIYKFK